MLPVAFLGICDSSTGYAEGHQILWRQDFVGLRRHFLSPVFPWSAAGIQFAFAVFDVAAMQSIRLSVSSPRGDEILFFNLGITPVVADGDERPLLAVSPQPGPGAITFNAPPMLPVDEPIWVAMACTAPESTLETPGRYSVHATINGVSKAIGSFECVAYSVPPLSEQTVAALKADPLARQELRIQYKCNHCGETLRAYAAIARRQGTEKAGFTWYAALPDRFDCTCGKLRADLSLMRGGLHAFLGRPMRANGDLSVVPMYRRQALEGIYRAFVALLDSNPDEERVQEFIAANPVILGPLSAAKLWAKAPVLSRFKTDFVVLNHRSELVLIELERPGTKLLKTDGGVAAGLQTPLNQVWDWFHELEEHRAAVLTGLDLLPQDVAGVRAVVIAGRDKDYDPTDLQKLKKRDFGRKVEVLTYDDLAAGFINMVRNFVGE